MRYRFIHRCKSTGWAISSSHLQHSILSVLTDTVHSQLSFNVSRTLLMNLRLPIVEFSPTNTDKLNLFVFVTAASDNHFIKLRIPF
jgi:hypothetical protein